MGALTGLFVGLLCWPHFTLAQVFLCVCVGICLGVSVRSLVRGEFLFTWSGLPPKTLVGRKARVMAVAYLALGVYVASALAQSFGASIAAFQ